MPPRKRAGLYIRVSTEMQREKFSIPAQESLLRELAKQHEFSSSRIMDVNCTTCGFTLVREMKSYKCNVCHVEFSAPARTRCVHCESDDIEEIDPLALPWTPEPLTYPITQEKIYS